MSFSQGLSGLNAASTDLDVIGNNIANAGTVGFKQSVAQFADMYATALAGTGSNTVGIGTKVAAIAQQFNQGDITTTNRTLDVAISGNGFFRLSNNGTINYSRNGQFQLDKDGFIVNAQGMRLTGYPANSNGVISSVSPQDLQIPTGDLAPKATSTVTAQFNLDSRTTPIDQGATPFNAGDPTTYTNGTSLSVYDSLGNAHTVMLYFVNTGSGQWNVYGTLDGSSTALNGGAPLTQLAFDGTGALTSGGKLTGVALPYTNGAAPGSVAINFGGTTQYGNSYTPNALNQDGYTSGQLTGFSIGADGVIKGQYSNGQGATLGQVALANFANPQGLTPMGDNAWQESAASGNAVVGAPGGTNMGKLNAGAVEESNVDLTQELVSMITAQRNYQANAQTIKTENQLMQTLVNLQ